MTFEMNHELSLELAVDFAYYKQASLLAARLGMEFETLGKPAKNLIKNKLRAEYAIDENFVFMDDLPGWHIW